jgi:hypothetical protein
MLLRRVTQHIRTQNWFAVLVDFVIVVVGVFVGLQVQDWNDARKERVEEQALLNRLYTETRALLDANKEELNALQARGEVLIGVNSVLFSQEPLRKISPVECRNIAGSHVYRRPPDELPVLDEMLETGRFDLLQDQAVKDNLRGYVMLRERARAYYGEAVNELFRLHSRHPSLIVVHRVPNTSDSDVEWGGLSGDGYRWLPECDSEKMRENTAFLNEYADNLSRINSLARFVAQRRDHLIELERILSEAISRDDLSTQGR